jgi:hypothetical protein
VSFNNVPKHRIAFQNRRQSTHMLMIFMCFCSKIDRTKMSLKAGYHVEYLY